jgi:hypothetical protein
VIGASEASSGGGVSDDAVDDGDAGRFGEFIVEERESRNSWVAVSRNLNSSSSPRDAFSPTNAI